MFGLAELALGTRAPLGRFPMALVLAIGTAAVQDAGGPQDARGSGSTPVRRGRASGFEEPWVQVLLAFNVAFLTLLFLVPAWRASRSSGEHEEDDPLVDWLIGPRGGRPF